MQVKLQNKNKSIHPVKEVQTYRSAVVHAAHPDHSIIISYYNTNYKLIERTVNHNLEC